MPKALRIFWWWHSGICIFWVQYAWKTYICHRFIAIGLNIFYWRPSLGKVLTLVGLQQFGVWWQPVTHAVNNIQNSHLFSVFVMNDKKQHQKRQNKFSEKGNQLLWPTMHCNAGVRYRDEKVRGGELEGGKAEGWEGKRRSRSYGNVSRGGDGNLRRWQIQCIVVAHFQVADTMAPSLHEPNVWWSSTPRCTDVHIEAHQGVQERHTTRQKEAHWDAKWGVQ